MMQNLRQETFWLHLHTELSTCQTVKLSFCHSVFLVSIYLSVCYHLTTRGATLGLTCGLLGTPVSPTLAACAASFWSGVKVA